MWSWRSQKQKKNPWHVWTALNSAHALCTLTWILVSTNLTFQDTHMIKSNYMMHSCDIREADDHIIPWNLRASWHGLLSTDQDAIYVCAATVYFCRKKNTRLSVRVMFHCISCRNRGKVVNSVTAKESRKQPAGQSVADKIPPNQRRECRATPLAGSLVQIIAVRTKQQVARNKPIRLVVKRLPVGLRIVGAGHLREILDSVLYLLR